MRKGDEAIGEIINSHRELRVFQTAFALALSVMKLTDVFPSAERYRLVDQMCRASTSVCANIAEAWRKRRYKAAFIAKLSDAESEACEMQVWLELAFRRGFIPKDEFATFFRDYDQVLGQLVTMIHNADRWLIRSKKTASKARI